MYNRFFTYLLIFIVTFSLGSCRRAIERAEQNIRIERVESAERQGLRGAKVVLQVRNNTNNKLVFKHITFTLYYADARVADIVLRESVTVEKQTNGNVVSLWRIDYSDPLAPSVIARKLRQKEIDRIALSYTVKGRAGVAPVKIHREATPLSEFMDNFALSLDEIINLLGNE